MKRILIIIFALLLFFGAKSQVAINTDGSAPDGSAILDIKSTTAGVLIPRMTQAEKNAIPSPAEGLLVYQSDADTGFYYYNGTKWLYIGNEDNNLWKGDAANSYTYLTNTADSVGIGTTTPKYKLDVNGFMAATNQISVIPLWTGNSYSMTNTSGQDLSNCESGFEPSLYTPSGDVQVKLVIRVTSASGTNNFQLHAYDNSNEAYPIVYNDTWTWASTSSGWVVSSDWKDWSPGTNAWEVHLFGWTSSGGHADFNSAYLLVRPKQ